MSSQIKKYNVERVLEEHMPCLLRLIGNQPISWNTINSGMQNYLAERRKKLADSGETKILQETTFYSFLVGNYQGKKETAPMFDFFETTCTQLYERLSKDELIHLHKMVKPVLSNFDYKYLNFIGELATLNAYKSKGNSLLNIEEKAYHQNDIRADLFMRRDSDNYEFFVEIVNIHLEELSGEHLGKRNLKESSEIKSHIESKLQAKSKKTFYDSPKRDIYIQPVIWTENGEQMKIVSKLYLDKEIEMKNIYVPMCYLAYKLSDGTFEQRFEYVTTILNGLTEKG